jgi:WD40 repeat protein
LQKKRSERFRSNSMKNPSHVLSSSASTETLSDLNQTSSPSLEMSDSTISMNNNNGNTTSSSKSFGSMEKYCGFRYLYGLEESGHTDRVTGLCTVQKSAEEHYLLSVSWDTSIILWDIWRDNNHLKKVVNQVHKDYISGIEYAKSRHEFATYSVDGSVYIWEFDSLNKVPFIFTFIFLLPFSQKMSLEGHTGEVVAVRWHQSFENWVTGSMDHTIRLWDPAGRPLQTIRTPTGVTALCIDLVRHFVVAAATDCVIRVYDTNTDMILQENTGHVDVITCIAFVPQTQQYVSSSWDTSVRTWAAPNHQGLGAEETTSLVRLKARPNPGQASMAAIMRPLSSSSTSTNITSGVSSNKGGKFGDGDGNDESNTGDSNNTNNSNKNKSLSTLGKSNSFMNPKALWIEEREYEDNSTMVVLDVDKKPKSAYERLMIGHTALTKPSFSWKSLSVSNVAGGTDAFIDDAQKSKKGSVNDGGMRASASGSLPPIHSANLKSISRNGSRT